MSAARRSILGSVSSGFIARLYAGVYYGASHFPMFGNDAVVRSVDILRRVGAVMNDPSQLLRIRKRFRHRRRLSTEIFRGVPMGERFAQRRNPGAWGTVDYKNPGMTVFGSLNPSGREKPSE